MNYIYTITDRPDSVLFKKMIESLCSHCGDFKLFLNVFETNVEIIDFCKEKLKNRVIIKPIFHHLWDGRRMAFKIENITTMPLYENDNVFILDDDLIIKDNIFEIFNQDFDVCVTSRHYQYWYPVNAGVWGFKWNERTKNFLNFYITQIRSPSWLPLVNFRKHFARDNSLDWWVDQDFLCTMYSNRLPFPCKLKDIGPTYNFCPSVEEAIPGTFEKAKREIIAAVNNKDIKILHLKGRLKTIVEEIKITNGIK